MNNAANQENEMKTANPNDLILNGTIITKSWIDDGDYIVRSRRGDAYQLVQLPMGGASCPMMVHASEISDWLVVSGE